MYAVIMAGGGGTRLWPVSRSETPKPLTDGAPSRVTTTPLRMNSSAFNR